MTTSHGGTNPAGTTPPGGPFHGYATPGSVPPPPASPRPGPRNTLAIAALVVAVIGFVFAVMRGAFIVGWVLLPIAFILALVALAQHDRKKGTAVAALIVTIVGTVAGAVAFTTSVGDAFNQAFAGTSPTVVQPAQAAATQQPATQAAAQAGQAASELGTRDNPYPVGTEVATSEWKVKVNSFTADATKQVLAANSFNKKPADGKAYALVNVTLTYQGTEKSSTMLVGVNYVTASGNVVTGTESFAVAPHPLGLEELYKGATATGDVALEIPKGDAGLIRVRPGMLADEVFFALK